MSAILSTYAGISLNGAISHIYIGTIPLVGVAEQGVAQVTVRMTTTQSVMQVGMDGAVVPSVVPGDQGEIEIQVWQTSTIHQDLLAWWNALTAARDAGDVSQWFTGTCFLSNTIDGSSHYATGVAPQKVPDKTYQEQAQRVPWILTAANIVNE